MTTLRFFPRHYVDAALSAGWKVHPFGDRRDWAVLMEGGETAAEPAVPKVKRTRNERRPSNRSQGAKSRIERLTMEAAAR